MMDRLFRCFLAIMLLFPLISSGQDKKPEIEVILDWQWDVQDAGKNSKGDYFIISRIAEVNHLFIWHTNTAVVYPFAIAVKNIQHAFWSDKDELLIEAESGLYKWTGGELKGMLTDREIMLSQAGLNHTENLLVFSGKRPNDREPLLYTFDFVYQNLNKFDGTEGFGFPAFSPSDELIVCSATQNERKVLKLWHWYAKPYSTITNDTLDWLQAVWSDTDYRLFAVGASENAYYLMSLRKDGTSPVYLGKSQNPLVLLNYCSKQKKLLALEEQSDGRKRLVNIVIHSL